MRKERTIPHAGYSTIITKKKVEDLDIFMFNNIKSGIRDIFGLSNKAVLDEIVLTLYRLNPCRKPEGQRLGGHVYIKGVTVRFGFDAVRTPQLPTDCQKQSNGNAS